jgi:undecaprenyl pyrophosphate phosphatase UppP
MSIPAIFGVEIVLQIKHLITVDFSSILAVVISFIVGLLTINVLLKVARNVDFSNLCIILGLMTALFGITQLS